jgi:hypothetical protein
LYQRLTGALRRVLEALGLDRRPVDATPPHRDATDKIVAAIAAGGSYHG